MHDLVRFFCLVGVGIRDVSSFFINFLVVCIFCSNFAPLNSMKIDMMKSVRFIPLVLLCVLTACHSNTSSCSSSSPVAEWNRATQRLNNMA